VTDFIHDTPDELPRSTIQHDVSLDPNSRLATILGSSSVAVNSLHHQSVQKPAPGIKITGYSPDGVIESLEAPDKHFVLSVQWHPEDLYTNDDSMKQLFASFIEAARESAARKQYAR
jgi:putative glutamine amidotransferase